MRNNQNRLAAPPVADAQTAPAAAAANLSFVVPTEFVELPSKGKFYPADHPLHNQKTIEIRYMTAKEEDILASTALIKNGLVIERLLSNIIVLDMDPTTLLVGDRSAIMIAARISSYGYDYKASVYCEACQKHQEYGFDLRKANLRQTCFDQKFLSDNNIKINEEKGIFEVKLPKSNVLLGIKLITGKKERNTDEVEESNQNLVTDTLSRFVVSVNGDETPSTVAEFVCNMLAADSRYLRIILSDLTPNIDLNQEFTCKECGNSQDKEVPLTAEFFWPE